MRRILMTATAATALLAGAAYAQPKDCTAAMQDVEARYGEMQMSPTTSKVIYDLRNAAMQLRNQGMTEACESVTASLNDVIDAYHTKAINAEASDDPAVEGEATAVWSTDADEATVRERVVPFEQRAEVTDTQSLVGINVYNFQNEFLGEVDGLLMAKGAPSHMIVGHGGFWNIGDEEAAIPLAKMHWDPEWNVFYVDMTTEQLEKAPDYDKTEDGSWTIDTNDEYYELSQIIQ